MSPQPVPAAEVPDLVAITLEFTHEELGIIYSGVRMLHSVAQSNSRAYQPDDPRKPYWDVQLQACVGILSKIKKARND